MPRHLAFLRGMNVGGHRITNEELRALFTSMGFEDVATFRAAGNVVFDSPDRASAKLQARIEEGLQDALGYAVPTFLRSRTQVNAIAAHKPFAEPAVKASKGKLQVALLTKVPTKAAAAEVLAMATDDDRLAIQAGELYWLPVGGTMESALDFKVITKAIGQMTTRTKGTMDEMAARYCT